MADTKITALTALTAADPINDVIPIVDVSDTSMAASGTTKKISVNNILGASGTATLASATITGDLTVDTNVLKVDTTNNRVGIGTASPATALQVVGEIRSSADISNSSDTIIYSFAGGTAGSVRAGLQLIGSTPEIRVYLSSATALTINSTSNLVLKGGTAAADGVGVTFPATQVASSDANCLDDYEEGTFVPTITSGATAVTYSPQTGHYTKVGRIVEIHIQVTTTAATRDANQFIIGGLPFSSSNFGSGVIGYSNSGFVSTAGGNKPNLYVSLTGVEFYTSAGGSFAGTTIANDAFDLRFSATYFV